MLSSLEFYSPPGEPNQDNEAGGVKAIKESPEQNEGELRSLDQEFYVTDHSADNVDTGSPERLRELYADIAKDGISSVRYDWHWNKVEPEEGGFRDDLLSRYGQAAEIMDEVGLEPPTIILSNIPDWALRLYKEDKEEFFNAYREYVEKVKDNLIQVHGKTGKLIPRVQILNELNNNVYTPIAAADLPRLCSITREALSDYNPDVKLMGTIFAGNLPEVVKKATLGKVKLGTHVSDYLKEFGEVLKNFDVIAVDYYPGMWHVPLGEARENKKEIFRQLGLLKKTMEEIATWGKEYELGEVGIQTNMPLMGDGHNQDRQRYFYDVFFRSYKKMLIDFQESGIRLPTRIGLYEAIDEPPKNMLGKALRKLTPFPEHDLGMRKGDLSRKEILQGNRHIPAGEERGSSQLSRIIKYINKPAERK